MTHESVDLNLLLEVRNSVKKLANIQPKRLRPKLKETMEKHTSPNKSETDTPLRLLKPYVLPQEKKRRKDNQARFFLF